jgi:hypothetical protein
VLQFGYVICERVELIGLLVAVSLSLFGQVDWIPFDAPCNEQIETAYQSGAEKGQHPQELR